MISALVLNVHNGWLTLPEWFRKGLRGAAVGGFVAVTALNLAIPGSLAEVKAEGLLGVSAFAGAAWAVARVTLLPAFVTWFLSLTSITPIVRPTTLTPIQSDEWIKI